MKLEKQYMHLYAITDRKWTKTSGELMQHIRQAIDGGAGMVQLREKKLGDADFLEEARSFMAICREKGALGIINDNVEVAKACDADGVHVGQEDLDAGHVRAILGPDKIIGVSAHTVEEAVQAEKAGADYLGVGAAFPTSSKDDTDVITRETIRQITKAVQIPVVAIGGITAENVGSLHGCGLAGIAVISAVFGQKDVYEAAKNLKALTEKL